MKQQVILWLEEATVQGGGGGGGMYGVDMKTHLLLQT